MCLLTPEYDRIAVVRQECEFEPSGMTFKRSDWINFGFSNGGKHIRYPDWMSSAHTGEEMPIAKIPEGIDFKPGQENVHAGKARFYKLTYGRYLIAMNRTSGESFALQIPQEFRRARNLSQRGERITVGNLSVGPNSTVVLVR